jgi:hypothetical protein
MTAPPTTGLHCGGSLNELSADLSVHGLDVRPASRAMDFLPLQVVSARTYGSAEASTIARKLLTSSRAPYWPSALR